jgi:hypothetical protein
MKISKEMREKFEPLVAYLLAVLTGCLLYALTGCTTTRTEYVPVETVRERVDTVRLLAARVDTVEAVDSVLVWVSGDTVLVDKIRYRYKYRERVDTVYRAKVDSVMVQEPYPVEVTKEVARKLSWWQKCLMWVGGAVLACAAVCAGIKVREWVKKKGS